MDTKDRSDIKVCRVLTRLNVGGPAIHAIHLSRGLACSGFQTILMAGHKEAGEGSLWPEAEAVGIEPIRVPGLRRPLRPGADLKALYWLTQFFRGARPTIVHTHMAKAGALGRIAARLARVPVILHTYHGHVFTGYFSPVQTRLFLAIERALARFTTRLVVLSAGQRETLLSYGIGRPAQYVTIPLGLDLTPLVECSRFRGALRQELDLDASTPLVGIVARLAPIKDHALFLEALAQLVHMQPEVRAIVVGDGPLRGGLEGLAQQRGLADRVWFLGWRRDLTRIYADLDVAILTSRNEGTPVALIEAMAAGVPVVATAVGGVPDLVRDGVTGILAAAGDARAIAEAAARLLADRERGRTLGTAGQQAVFPQHDVAHLLERMAELYHDVAARSRE